ncbi:hypothetical protein ACZ90_06880 [Streptomyces albus subsp. albus]|nr:hypothetical protein ACZ90_06880 [Streptomyces albus subsp. albus]
MAGESPDTSEQQKSSGETTLGEQDPRLAVFRETEASGGDRDGSGPDAGAASTESAEPAADRATVTFRVRSEAEADAKGPASGSAEARPEAESRAKGSAKAGDEHAEASDAGARAAAAPEPSAGADVDADAPDVRGGESGDAKAEGAPADGAALGAVSGDKSDEADEAGKSGEVTASSDAPEADGERSAMTGALPVRPGARASAARRTESAEKSDTEKNGAADRAEPGEAAGTGGGDARLRAAVAAWVSGSGDGDAEPTAQDTADSDADQGTEDKGEDKGAKGKGAEDSGAERDGTAEGSREDTRTMSFGTLRQKSGEQATDRATAFFGAVRAKESPAGDEAEGDGAERRSADRATAFFGAVRPRTAPETDRPDADGTPEGAKGAAGEARAKKTESGKPADRAKGGTAADGDTAGAGVDRATAFFGTVRPSEKPDAAEQDKGGKPAADPERKTAEPAADAKRKDTKPAAKAGTARKPPVDQATTALKALGTPGGASGEAKGRDGASPAGKASTFVPLRSADEPAAKAGTAPGAGSTPGSGPAPLPESERTKQQPLPPNGQQPLDLLAQLTNTPPPEPTPVRTVVRRVKIWTPLVVLLLIVFCTAQVLRPLPEPELRLAEQTSFTFPGERFAMPWPGQGQATAMVEGVGSLGTYGAQKPVPIASVTKVMTAYVVLKDHPLKPDETGETITIDAQAGEESSAQDESRATVKKGQKFNQRQMLEMTMIPSANNAARQLARWDAGTEAAFVKKMNDAAKALGMTHTVYTDPSGLKATTKSTAVDQLKLAREVMKDATFRQIVATPDIEIPGVGRKFNNNALLSKSELGVRGIKTGSSTPAGGALMWATYRTVGGKDRLVLGVTLDQHTSSTDSNAHLQFALDKAEEQIRAVRGALTDATLVKKGQVVGHVDDGLGGSTPVVATRDLKGAGWPGFTAGFTLTADAKGVPHSAKAGTVVGRLTVGSGPGRASVPVALQQDLSEPSFGAKLTRIS